VIAALIASAGAHGQDTFELDPLEVSAPGPAGDPMRMPAAVAAVEALDLRQGRQGLQLDEALSRVPGALFLNRYNFAQNLRVSIRGFGARAPFGVRGIRLRVDGLPETLPDGQSQIDAVDLESVSRIELIRGPAAAAFGNAAGGVIDIRTADRIETGHRLDLRLQGGSEGFRRAGVRAAVAGESWRGHLSAWQLEHEGYRAQSETRKRMAHARLDHESGAGCRLTTFVTVLDQPFGKDPGGLTRAEADDDPRRAAPNALALDAGQEVRQQRIGWVLQDEVTLDGGIDAYLFYTRREFEQQLPFPGASRIRFDRAFFGGGASYADRIRLIERPLDYSFGVEIHRQRDDRQRYLVDANGALGEQIQDAIESAAGVGIHGRIDYALSARLDLTLGMRGDFIRFSIDDVLDAGSGSGSRDYDEFSYMAGIGWQWRPAHRLYANLGSAFETPTFTEFRDPSVPGQGFDPGLEPQRAVNVEGGARGALATGLRYELALFSIRTRGEIVQIASDPNRFANAARTRREGVELGLDYDLAERWTLRVAYTASRFRFTRFTDAAGKSLSGRRLPGLPEHALFGELAWRKPDRWVIADLLTISSRHADNANAVNVAGHTVINLRAGREVKAGKRLIEVFAGVNNIGDRKWFSNIRVDAAGGRYFEPAPGRNWYAGVSARM
jgi:iron complex outermembrane receptor protein